MSYKTQAKRPNGTEYEEVEMIDDLYGQHRYGVEFPDGAIYAEKDCEVMNSDNWQEQFLQKLRNVYATVFQLSGYDEKQLAEKEKYMVDFVSQLLSQQQSKSPLGYSNWLEHGKKYGYVNYFVDELTKQNKK